MTAVLTVRAMGEVQNPVFDNPLLLDKIVKYSVYKPDGKELNSKYLSTIRLVNKNWLHSVNRALKYSSDSAINISFDSEFSSNHNSSHSKSKNVLEEFVSLFSQTSRFENSVLPVWFSMDPTDFKKKNYKILKNFFENCGDLVSTLVVDIPDDGGFMPLTFNDLKFPILKTIYFSFDSPRDRTYTRKTALGNANAWKFFQEILRSALNLKNFILSEVDDLDQAGNMLLNNNLPKLELLRLSTNKLPNDKLLIFKILEKLKTQLKTLFVSLEGFDTDKPHNLSVTIRFPLMEKLRKVKLWGQGFELSPDTKSDWPRCMPNVFVLEFGEQTNHQVLNWIQGIIFENVKKLTVHLVEDLFGTRSLSSPNFALLNEIQTTFPNIQKLKLAFSLRDLSGLVYIFQNLSHVKKLHLKFHGKQDSSTECKLASFFLGIPIRDATVLSHMETKREVNIDRSKSIVNLKELNSLTLWIQERYDEPPRKYPLFLRVVSRHGLEKMSQLQEIIFKGGFQDDLDSDG